MVIGFKWINRIPGLRRPERTAYIMLELFLILAFVCFIRDYLFVRFPAMYTILQYALVLTFTIAVFTFARSRLGQARYHRRFYPMVAMGVCFILWCLARGYWLNGSRGFEELTRQALYLSMAFYLISIANDRICLANLMRLLCILFWIGAIICWITRDIHFARTNALGQMIEEDVNRGTDTLGYRFRPILNCFPIFFFAGVFWKKRMPLWEWVMYLGTIVPYSYLQVAVFKFRSGLLICGLVMALSAFYSIKRMKVGAILGVGLMVFMGAIYFLFGSAGEGVRERFASKQQSGLIDMIEGERGAEFKCMMRDMSLVDKLVGKGFGGGYDASEAIYGATEWHTIHLGFLIVFLYGGVFMFLFYYSIFIRAATRNDPNWRRAGDFMLVCKLFVIVEIIHFSFNPMPFLYSLIFPHLPFFMAAGVLWSDKQQSLFQTVLPERGAL